jgi:hypothetical protein
LSSEKLTGFKHPSLFFLAISDTYTSFFLQLPSGVEYGKSIYVPSFGWAVIGRLGNDLNAAQVLSSLDAEWKVGPAMGKNETFGDKICMFQVNPISALTVRKM